MIDKILDKLGLVRKNNIPGITYVGDLDDLKKIEDTIIDSISSTEGIIEYFDMTITADVLRYYNAPDEISRERVRGGLERVRHIRNRIIKTRKEKEVKPKKKVTKLPGVRY